MELSCTYILSQVFTILMYLFLAISYYSKNRKKVLLLNNLGVISIGIAYILLKAWSGFALNVVSFFRNQIFLYDENKYGKRDKMNKKDYIIFIVLTILFLISAIITYDGFLSLFSFFATTLFTLSVTQKNVKLYKFLGLPTSMCWIVYNIHIFSIMGIVLESILLVFAFIGYLSHDKIMVGD